MLFLLGIPGIQLCDERTADVVPYAEGGAGDDGPSYSSTTGSMQRKNFSIT